MTDTNSQATTAARTQRVAAAPARQNRRVDCPTLPLATRVASALASVLISSALLGSVAVGMTSQADAPVIASQPAGTARA
jgi:hypothetical protein